MDRSTLYVACAVAFVLWFLSKSRYLRTRWRNPTLWALCAAILLTAATMWFAAPANHFLVARLTGVPNSAMPVITSCQAAAGASYLALALLWRYPAGTAWRRLRWILAACVLAIAAMVVLFGASSVPEEHPLDFGITYGTQPTVAAFLMLWLLWVLIGHVVLAYWCFTWARDHASATLPWLRWGLRMFGAFGVDVACFAVTGIVCNGAHWFGVDALDPVYRTAPPILGLISTVLLAAALTLPKLGPRLSVAFRWLGRWRVYFRLRPLHRAVRHVAPAMVFVARGRRLDAYHRTRRMMIELSDWRSTLAPLFDPAVATAAERLGREANLTADALAATVEAAQLKAASHAWQRGVQVADDAEPARCAPSGHDARDGVIDTELTWWVQVAQTFGGSPIVARALAEHVAAAAVSADAAETA